MPDYKEMYFKMLLACEEATNIIISAQKERKALYISAKQEQKMIFVTPENNEENQNKCL